jgi:transcriptional regulator with XRE-family HTH domain
MKLKEYLIREKISVTNAAKKLGISRTYLDMIIKNDRNPSLELAQAIEDFTDGEVSVDRLISKKKEKFRCPLCEKVLSPQKYKAMLSKGKKTQSDNKPFRIIKNGKKRLKSRNK